MKIRIVGAGPSGLYLAILLKRQRPGWDIAVLEQNASDSTFGFGVVFSDSALDFLREDDEATFKLIASELERWNDINIVHQGVRVAIDGVGFAAIGRLHLLQILQREAIRLGVEIKYNTAVGDIRSIEDADLIVGADGVNSLVRGAAEEQFGTQCSYLKNRFVWFGTTKRFETLTQTFVRHKSGYFNAHHYRYSPSMSTFIVECDEKTMADGRFDQLDEMELKAHLESVFAETLDGHALVSNRSIWRQFPIIQNHRWSVGNKVILGDSLHTAHFSIGSGTRLALEDAIALAKAIVSEALVGAALEKYQSSRKPILDKLVSAANASASWYETFPDRMHLSPYEFAMSYITRSGRIDRERLRKLAPKFVADYEMTQTIDKLKAGA